MIRQRDGFTLHQPLELEALFAALEEVFQTLQQESGIAFRRSPNPPERHARSDSFYLIYKGPLPAENSVKADITRGETLVFERRQLHSPGY